jgi:hypothetical protein
MYQRARLVCRLSGGGDHSANCPAGVLCPRHLATAYAVVLLSQTYYLAFEGTNPQTMRLWLLDSTANDTIVLHVRYDLTQRIQVRRLRSQETGCVPTTASLTAVPL